MQPVGPGKSLVVGHTAEKIVGGHVEGVLCQNSALLKDCIESVNALMRNVAVLATALTDINALRKAQAVLVSNEP